MASVRLLLVEGPMNAEGARKDAQLMELAKAAKQKGQNYALESKFPGVSNHQAADELVVALNIAYVSPLYQAGEPFSGAIFFHEGGGTWRKKE